MGKECVSVKAPIRIATLFSGIGAVEFALKRLRLESQIIFACDNGEIEIEYDKDKEYSKVLELCCSQAKADYVEQLYKSKSRKRNYMKESYIANYDLHNGVFFYDACLLDGRDFFNEVDLFVGGSPCQSFSSVGAQRGLEDARGTLFYEFARIISEVQPKVFIYENVQNVLRHDKGNTWKIMQGVFSSLGYEFDSKVLNAVDFGIPQVRNRLFVVGYRRDLKKVPLIENTITNIPDFDMHQFLESNCSLGNFTSDSSGALKVKKTRHKRVDDCYYLTPGIKRYVMNEGTKNYRTKVKIDLPIARTLLKTMHWHHRAGVDNYMREFDDIRMLTEREALRLMGFTDDFKIVVPKTKIYMQAGNSIVVDVLMELLRNIIKDKVL